MYVVYFTYLAIQIEPARISKKKELYLVYETWTKLHNVDYVWCCVCSKYVNIFNYKNCSYSNAKRCKFF